MRFIAVIYQDKETDSAFGVHFPDVPGCFSAGDTFEEAEANAREALDLYFEDAEMPEPRSMDELHASGELVEHIAEGAMIVPISYVPIGGRKVRANVSIDEVLLEQMDGYAEANNITRAALISSLARKHLEKVT